ncbi:uncharacterized protein IL334_001433 [Kwoniella shivajii]|uniref:Uncharacterized protein n=1 Tax=Kwoniella shivajii TaxID=564305 RepID=A0ABZ1CS62_9TREE|nr:hypothetical protein IL334_001433 [Kwoniella shivajii]
MGRFRALLSQIAHPIHPEKRRSSNRQPSPPDEANLPDYETPQDLYPNLTPESLEPLSPVYSLIIDSIFDLRPSIVLSLSKSLYDRYLPRLYTDVTLRPNSFDGLWRSWQRGCAEDNSTIRAYKQSKVLHVMDKDSAFTVCTITCGDQPVFLPHSNLFPNVTKIELGWDVFVCQGDKGLYYMYLEFASQFGNQLKQGMLEELVLEILDSVNGPTRRQTLLEFDEGLKSKSIICILNGDWVPTRSDKAIGRGEHSLRIPMITPELKYAETIKMVIPKRLGPGDIEHLLYHLKKLYHDEQTMQETHQWNNDTNGKFKVEYWVYDAHDMKQSIEGRLKERNKDDIFSWMSDRVDFKEIDDENIGLDWSIVWRKLKGK